LTTKLRAIREEKITWAPNKLITLSNNDTALLKTSSNWEEPVYSQQELRGKLVYVQMKIIVLGYPVQGTGLLFGISKTNKVPKDAYRSGSAIALFNDATSSATKALLNVRANCVAKANDVIGMVVDRIKDKVRFYINAKCVATSIQKPSEFEPIYLVAWVFFQNCHLELGAYIPFHRLE
jgi:hypothetical protein